MVTEMKISEEIKVTARGLSRELLIFVASLLFIALFLGSYIFPSMPTWKLLLGSYIVGRIMYSMGQMFHKIDIQQKILKLLKNYHNVNKEAGTYNMTKWEEKFNSEFINDEEIADAFLDQHLMRTFWSDEKYNKTFTNLLKEKEKI